MINPQKHHRGDNEKRLAQVLLLVHDGTEAVLTISMIHCVIYNKWEINPEYNKVLN